MPPVRATATGIELDVWGPRAAQPGTAGRRSVAGGGERPPGMAPPTTVRAAGAGARRPAQPGSGVAARAQLRPWRSQAIRSGVGCFARPEPVRRGAAPVVQLQCGAGGGTSSAKTLNGKAASDDGEGRQ